MAKSEAVKLAQIQSRDKTIHEAAKVLCDPLWSSILGFVVVHEARKANLVGPVADDLLYAGIITINATRAGLVKEAREGAVGIAGALGQGLGALGQLAGSAGSVMTAAPIAGLAI